MGAGLNAGSAAQTRGPDHAAMIGPAGGGECPPAPVPTSSCQHSQPTKAKEEFGRSGGVRQQEPPPNLPRCSLPLSASGFCHLGGGTRQMPSTGMATHTIQPWPQWQRRKKATRGESGRWPRSAGSPPARPTLNTRFCLTWLLAPCLVCGAYPLPLSQAISTHIIPGGLLMAAFSRNSGRAAEGTEDLGEPARPPQRPCPA